MKEQNNYIKVINKEKVLEFKKNISLGFDEAEIIIENQLNDSSIISKIYINNYKYFKSLPNIAIINKNSTKKIKIIVDDKNYKVSDSDIFLIISHPIKEEEIKKDINDKNLNEFFKNKKFKEKGQKLFMIGNKIEEENNNNNKNLKNDKLMEKIRELEKEAYEQEEIKKEETKIEETKKEENKEIIKDNKKNRIMIYVYLGILILLVAFILFKKQLI